jgi:hypothetical protein
MAQLKNFQDGSAGDSVTVGGNLYVTGTSTTTGAITASGGISGNITSSSATITGGTINGAVIGGSSAQAITGTTVTASTGFVGGLTGNVTGNTTGTHTGAVTGNVTGNLTGNVTGNVTASSGTSTFNNVTIDGTLDMSSGTVGTITGLATPVNPSDAATKGYVDTADALKLNLSGGTMSGAIAMGTNKITGLGTPTADADAVTKSYVDAIAQGIDAKASCVAATTTNITLSGTQTIDGIAVSAGDRVLVKDQSTSANNGIYLASASSWTRTTDADAWTELVAAYTFIEGGTVNGSNGFICTVAAGGTLGTTAITFAQFSGAGQIVAGAGLTKTGNTLDVGTASSSRIVVNSDNIDLATTGVTANTYKSVTVDTYGRITAGTNPTTISGFGITDAYTKTEIDTSLSGKLSTSGGTMSGAIAMGTSKITGLGDPTNNQDAATKTYVDGILGSATSAATSAAAAATSASNAATSETNASTSAGNASTSATAAAASATSAAASYDSFDDRYLGAKSTAPTVDNDGNALLTGALYWNTSTSELYLWTGSTWTRSALSGADYVAKSGDTMTGALTTTGLTISGGTANGVAYLNGSKAVTSGSALTYNGTGLGVGISSAGYLLDVSTPLTGTTVGSNVALNLESQASGRDVEIRMGDTVNSSGRFGYLSGSLYWAFGSTEQMRLTSTGLGIGTSSPAAKLHTSTTTAGNSVGALLANPNQSGSADSVSINFGLGRTVDSFLFSTPAISFVKEQQWTSTGSTIDGALTFSTILNETSSEKMRITSAGNVGIGTNSPARKLDVYGSIQAADASGIQSVMWSQAISGAGGIGTNNNYPFAFLTNGTERARFSAAGGFSVGTTADAGAGGIYATGNITAYYSDDRLKTRLGNIENALDKVETLSGFYYEANETAQALGYKVKREVGVSAQSVQAILPEIVSPAPIDQQYLTVDYERLVPLLIEAVKELSEKVKALEAK